jgi:hypothetical protein
MPATKTSGSWREGDVSSCTGIDALRAQGHSGHVTDDRVPGVQRSTTALYRCTLCDNVELYGNAGAPECPNESWHPMVLADDPAPN